MDQFGVIWKKLHVEERFVWAFADSGQLLDF
jgi:hypothetical protein